VKSAAPPSSPRGSVCSSRPGRCSSRPGRPGRLPSAPCALSSQVQDPALVERLRAILRGQQTGSAEQAAPNVDLRFDAPREGTLTLNGEEWPASLRDLPTVVEVHRSLNDVDLVKAGNVGGVVLVGHKDARAPPGSEARDGVTPPLRRARDRVFRRDPVPDRIVVPRVERALLRLLAGGAPEGCEIEDVEETWDDAARRWQPVLTKSHRKGGDGVGGKGGRRAPAPALPVAAAGGGGGGTGGAGVAEIEVDGIDEADLGDDLDDVL